MKKIASLFMVLMVITSGCRQSHSQQQPQSREPASPVIEVAHLEDGETPVVPVQVSKDVQVIGNMTITTLEMSFYNPNDRILEGEFKFPLNEGADVIRFALDIDGHLREGVVVEKTKGRRVFEAITRVQVDPGLLEKTEGNNFRARIYPLPPKGHRRIVIAYEEVTGTDTGGKKEKVFVEKDQKEGTTYFYTQLYPVLKPVNKAKPSRIALFWDASLSMENKDRTKEIEFLQAYLKKTGNPEVNLYPFSSIPYPPERYKGNPANLARRLKNMTYDGGSWFGQLNLKDIAADEIWVFSDGLNNTGNALPDIGDIPVYCVTSVPGADYSFLHNLSDLTGGQFFNLNGNSPEEAVKKAIQKPYRLIRTTHISGEINDLVFSSPVINGPGGISVSGKLQTAQAHLQLHFGTGDEILHTEDIIIKTDQAEDMNGMVARRWATLKINGLNGVYEANRKEIEELGKKYNIVTRNTSLIVLDNVEDYVRYDITPPEELLDRFMVLKQHYSQALDNRHTYHLQYITNLFNLRKGWWDKEDYRFRMQTNSWRWDTDHPLPDFVHDTEAEFIQTEAPEEEYDTPSYAQMPAHESYIIEGEEEVLAYDTHERYAARDYSDADVAYDIRIPPKKVINHNPNFRSVIKTEKFTPDNEYMKKLKSVNDNKLYDTYLLLRKKYKQDTDFYMDVAQLFYDRGDKEKAFLILSNIAELDLDNHRLLRAMAYQAEAWGYMDCAIYLFGKVKAERPDEPQSFRDLALAYAGVQKYQEAIDLLYQIVEQTWDERFPEIEVIAVAEMNEVIARATRENVPVSTHHIRKDLIYHMPANIRVVARWNTDNCDMDLHVTDPEGTLCYYSYPYTNAGGYLSRDFTQGYGPEEFFIKKVIAGTYTIQMNYFGTTVQTLQEPVILMVDIYTRYGEEKEQKETVVFRLSDVQEILTIATIEID